jgi:hypothetical protein
MRHLRRLVYKLGFRPKRGNPLYSPSLSLICGWRDRGGLLVQQELAPKPTPADIIKTVVEAREKYRPIRHQVNEDFFIFPAQIEALVRMDRGVEGRTYEQWVEMLIKHGWRVVTEEEMDIDE